MSIVAQFLSGDGDPAVVHYADDDAGRWGEIACRDRPWGRPPTFAIALSDGTAIAGEVSWDWAQRRVLRWIAEGV